MIEIWKDIKGFEGYQISNFGRVKSLSRKGSRKERILKAATSTTGYLFVSIRKKNKTFIIMIHFLVWGAFGDKKRDSHYLVVVHKNKNKKDNNFTNLGLSPKREIFSKRQDTTSKYVGVFFAKRSQKFEATILINRKRKHLGYYFSEKEARDAYVKALDNL